MDELSWTILQEEQGGRYSYPSSNPQERKLMQFLDTLRDMQPYEGGCHRITFINEPDAPETSPRKSIFSKVAKWFLAVLAVASIAGVFSVVSPREGLADKVVPRVCSYFG